MDNKTRTQLGITAVMAVVLVVLMWMNVIGPMVRRNAAALPSVPVSKSAPAAAVSPAANVPLSAADLQSRRDAAKEYEKKPWDRNPFVAEMPTGASVPAPEPQAPAPRFVAPPNFRLEGIVYDSNSPYAIINGELRVTGDYIQNFKIISIHQDTVTLEKDGNMIDLKIPSDI